MKILTARNVLFLAVLKLKLKENKSESGDGTRKVRGLVSK